MDRDAAPLMTLVICTRDRERNLPALFGALARLRAPVPWELVLVDSASRDDSNRLLRELSANLTVPVTVVTAPRPGLGRARNAGVRAARGALLVFTDDDCYPAEDFLSQVFDAFRNPELGYLGGRIELHDPDDHPFGIHTALVATPIPPGSAVPAGLVQGANMAFRREVLDAIDGFDDDLGAGTPFSNDDIDAVARASAAGFAGSYVAGPLVRHHHRRRTPAQVRATWTDYDRGRGAYYAKCLMDLPTRDLFARAWWWSLGVVPFRTTLREMQGALAYSWHRMRMWARERTGPVASAAL